MNEHYHFCGVGGSGMLPLAAIVRATGARVTGSDRALDAGRLAAKFDYLKRLGIELFAQDGSALDAGTILVTSAAVEPSIPDVVRAGELGLEQVTRPQLLARLLNAADTSVAVGGTSGKSPGSTSTRSRTNTSVVPLSSSTTMPAVADSNTTYRPSWDTGPARPSTGAPALVRVTSAVVAVSRSRTKP